jgi:hypothetical protein
VDVQLQVAFPRMTHVNLFYTPASESIRCYTGDGQASELFFALCPDDVIGLRMEDYSMPVDPEQAAERIVRGMLTAIKSGASSATEL